MIQGEKEHFTQSIHLIIHVSGSIIRRKLLVVFHFSILAQLILLLAE